jgi:hypothetical protein
MKGQIPLAISKSPQHTRVFLLISALKYPGYQEMELADILFQLLSSIGVFQTKGELTSTRQLARLIRVLSGHCELLQESVAESHVQVFSVLCQGVEERWTEQIFLQLDPQEMAELLLAAFEALLDPAIAWIELRGVYGMMGVATVLYWLNRDQVGIFSHGETLLLGNAEGKVRLILTYLPSDGTGMRWSRHIWKPHCGLPDILPNPEFGQSYDYQQRLTYKIEKKSVKLYVKTVDGLSDSEVLIIGAIAAGFIDVVLEEGRIFAPGCDDEVDWKKTPYRKIAGKRLGDFCHPDFVARRGDVMEDYGWDVDAIRALRLEFAAWERYRRRFRDSPEPEAMKTVNQRVRIIPRRPVRGTLDYADTALEDFLNHARSLETTVRPVSSDAAPRRAHILNYDLMQHILRVAQHGILSSFMDFGGLVEFYRPHVENTLVWRLLDPLNGSSTNLRKRKITTAELRRLCFASVGVLSTSVVDDRIPLVASGQGRTVFPLVITEHSTERHWLLQLGVLPGHITYDAQTFNILTEDEGPYRGERRDESGQPPKQLLDIDVDRHLNVSSAEPPHDPTKAKIRSNFSAYEDGRLMMQTRLYTGDEPGKVSKMINWVTYESTITQLVYATHIFKFRGADQIGAAQQLRRILDGDPVDALRTSDVHSMIGRLGLTGIYLVPCSPSRALGLSRENALVTYCPWNQVQRFFAADPAFNRSEHALYIQQGASLTDSVLEVVSNRQRFEPYHGHPRWKLITGQECTGMGLHISAVTAPAKRIQDKH